MIAANKSVSASAANPGREEHKFNWAEDAEEVLGTAAGMSPRQSKSSMRQKRPDGATVDPEADFDKIS